MGFGENQHGELCFGNNTPQTTPRKIQLPEPIKDAFTSEAHTIFLGTSGKIYLCGSLERPKGGKFFTPKFANDRDIVEKVFVGPDSSMVVKNSNDIFFAGFDGFNQSGLTRSLPDDQIRKERIFRLIPFDFRLRPDLFGWLSVTLRGKKTLSEVSLVDAVPENHQRKKFKPN